MDLFNRDDYLTEEGKKKNKQEEVKKARKRFTKTNNEMTEQIDEKVIDSDKIYDKAHIEIYDGVGLGRDWRVGKGKDKYKNSKEELDKASGGFEKVTNRLRDENPKDVPFGKFFKILGFLFKR